MNRTPAKWLMSNLSGFSMALGCMFQSQKSAADVSSLPSRTRFVEYTQSAP